jgi:hypothetical protein
MPLGQNRSEVIMFALQRERTSLRQADARTRTGDPFITSEVLYQLSYVGRGLHCSEESLVLFPLGKSSRSRAGGFPGDRIRQPWPATR